MPLTFQVAIFIVESYLLYDAELVIRRSGAIEQELALARVAGERRRALELRAGLLGAAEPHEEVPAHRRQEVIALESRLGSQRIDEGQPFRRTEGHGDRDRAVQLHDGGRRGLGERVVERRDACPVRLRRGVRSRVTGGDRALQRIGAEGSAQRLGALERGETAAHEQVIPARAVLVEKQDRLARRADSRGRARGLDLHESDEAVDLRLFWRELGEDAAEAQRLLAERRPHPVFARGRRVAFVEDEIDDLQHRREARGELVLARDLEGDARLRERPFGPDDSLGDGRLRDEECARDLVGRQAAEEAQRERCARLGGEYRMAGREHEAQEIVADVVVHTVDQGGFEIRRGYLLFELHLADELLVLALEELVPAEVIQRAVLRGGHEPGARAVRDARLRPSLEGGDEGVLREFLGETDVAHHPREAGDDLRGLDPPDRVDRAVRGGCGHGDRIGCALTASSPSSPARRAVPARARRAWEEGSRAESPRAPAPGGSRSFRCPKPGSAWPIRSPPPATSPGSSSIRRAPPSLRRRARR